MTRVAVCQVSIDIDDPVRTREALVGAAFDAGWMLDPNGYLAPVAVMVTATEDD